MALGRRITRLMKAHWGELVERVEQVIREESAESAAAQELQEGVRPDAPARRAPCAARRSAGVGGQPRLSRAGTA
jgi:hypothetical protein